MAELPPILTQENNAPIPELNPIFRKQQPIQEPTGYIQTYIDQFFMNPLAQMQASHADYMRPRSGPINTPPLNAMNVRGQAGLALTQEAIPVDTEFDLEKWLRADPQKIRWAHKFSDVYSEAVANNVWNHIKDNLDREDRLNNSEHWTAKVLGGLSTPDVLLPFGNIRRGVGVMSGIVRGAVTGLPYIATNEALNLIYNPTAQIDGLKERVLMGTAISALIGGGVGLLPKGRVDQLARNMLEESRNIVGRVTQDGIEMPLMSSVSQNEGKGFAPFVVRETGDTLVGFSEETSVNFSKYDTFVAKPNGDEVGSIYKIVPLDENTFKYIKANQTEKDMITGLSRADRGLPEQTLDEYIQYFINKGKKAPTHIILTKQGNGEYQASNTFFSRKAAEKYMKGRVDKGWFLPVLDENSEVANAWRNGIKAEPSFSPYVATETGATPTGFASARGLERIAARQGPWARVVNAGVRAYEDLANRFFGDYGVLFARNRQGIATEPSAFLAAEGWIAKAADTILDIKNLHANYLTDGLESTVIAGFNVRSSMASIGDKVRKIAGKQRMDGKLRTDEFDNAVFDAYTKAQITGVIEHAIPQVKQAAERLNQFFKEVADDAYKTNYIKGQEYGKFLETLKKEYDDLLKQMEEIAGSDLENGGTISEAMSNLRQSIEKEIHPLLKIPELKEKINDAAEKLKELKTSSTKYWQEQKPRLEKKLSNIQDRIKKLENKIIPKDTPFEAEKFYFQGHFYPAFVSGNRIVTIVDINGHKQPFYISTGTGGKKTVAKNKWYPFFGFGPEDGWLNKGSESQINSYYGSKILKNVSEHLDNTLGNLNKDDLPMGINFSGNHPQWKKDNSIDIEHFFKLFNPANHADSAILGQQNIETTLKRLNRRSNEFYGLSYKDRETLVTLQKSQIEISKKLEAAKNMDFKKDIEILMTPKQQQYFNSLNKNLSLFNKFLTKYENELSSFSDRTPLPFYFPHRWNVSEVLRNEDKLKEILTNHFEKTASAKGFSETSDDIAKRVQSTIDNIVGREDNAPNLPDDFDPMNSSSGRAFFTKSRELDIPTELIKDFIDTDLSSVLREYSRKAGLGIEYSRAFGTPDGEIAIGRASVQAAKEGKNVAEIASVEGDIRNVRDVMLNRVHSYDAIGNKEASILRSWFTLTSMGKAIFANAVEVSRIPWVLGIKETLGYALKSLGNRDIIRGMSEELRKNTSYYGELAFGLTYKRFIESGPDTFGSIGLYNKAMSSIERPLSYIASAPYYIANGVGPLTFFLKNYTGFVGSDILARRILSVAENVATKKDIEFLASYGISVEDAALIAKQPIQRNSGIILTNSHNWTDPNLVKKFFGAVDAITRRVITTPSAADKPAVLMGIVGKGTTRKESQMLALPFQLKSWGFAANNKILLSALQGRDANVMAGALGMFGLSYLMLNLKTPSYIWDKMGEDEKLLNAFEASGIGALYSDLNFIAETVSQNTIGIRPMAGMKPKFGMEADAFDAAGEFSGPAVSKVIDIFKAFNGGTPREQARVTVNAVPLNNLFWIPESFRAMGRKTLEEAYR